MKTVLLIDGGYLRASAKKSTISYDNRFIEMFSKKCTEAPEYLFRIFYYDSPQFRGTAQLPVSGNNTTFQASDTWLKDLAKLERFAVRKGTLGFRGWRPKSIPLNGGQPLTDADFAPIFEQKGVDMRIGLDIAEFSDKKTVERILMVSGDTDMIPALKKARRDGLEVVLIQLPQPVLRLHDTLLAHCDILREVQWPHP